MAAGIATLTELAKPGVYEMVEGKAKTLADGLRAAAEKAGVKVAINHSASLLTVFFTEQPVDNYAAAMSSDAAKFKVFFQSMLNQGIYLPPSQFECWFVSLAHSDEDLAKTLAAAETAFAAVAAMN